MKKLCKYSILVMLVMVFGVINIDALTDYGVCIGDECFSETLLTIEDGNGGKAVFDPTSKTLTLDNFNYDGIGFYDDSIGYVGIYSIGDINIVLKGENSIILNNDNVYDDECYLLGIYALKENDDNKGNVSIVNSGKDAKLDIKFASPSKYSVGIYTSDGDLNINGVTLNISNNKNETDAKRTLFACGMLAEYSLKINNSKINIEFGKTNLMSYGLYFQNNWPDKQTSATINNSDVMINIDDSNMYIYGIAILSKLTIDKSKIDITVGNSNESIGMILYEDVVINDSDVKVYAPYDGSFGIGIEYSNHDKTPLFKNSMIEALGGNTALYADDYSFENYKDKVVVVNEEAKPEGIVEWDQKSTLNLYKYFKVVESSNNEPTTETNSENFKIISNNLKDIIPLTTEESLLVRMGKNLNVRLFASEDEADILDEDKTLIQNNLNKYTFIKYLNLNLYKTIGDNDEEDVFELTNNIKLGVKLDESVLNTNNDMIRVYKVIRVHNGETEILDATFDSETQLLTFDTNQFSTYGLLYTDLPKLSKNPKTGDNIYIYISMLLVSIVSIFGIRLYNKKYNC